MSAEDNRLPQRGTFTFLFTDVQGSTQLLRGLGAAEYTKRLEDHRRLLRDEFQRVGGIELGTEGD